MNKYLEKIAEEEKKNKSKWQIGAGLGAAFGGNIIGSTPIGIAQLGVSKKVINEIHNPHNESDLGTIKKMIRDNDLKVSFNTRSHHVNKQFSNGELGNVFKDMVKGTKSPAFLPVKGKDGKKFVVGVKDRGIFGTEKTKVLNKDVIMHELGHAKDFSSFGKTKLGISTAGRLGGYGSVGMLMHKDTRDHATTVAALSTLPTLRDEAAANYHAYKGIQAHKGTGAARRFAKRLLPAQMGTYALGAASKVAGIYAGKKILDHLDKKK